MRISGISGIQDGDHNIPLKDFVPEYCMKYDGYCQSNIIAVSDSFFYLGASNVIRISGRGVLAIKFHLKGEPEASICGVTLGSK